MNMFSGRSKGSGRQRTSSAALLAAGLGLAGLLCLGNPTPAAAQMMGLDIYRGDDAQTSGIQLHSWGSGTIIGDKAYVYSGSESLKISTQGLYQGASIVFNKPFDLGPYLSDKNSYLQFVIIPPATPGETAGGRPGNFGPPGGFGKGSGIPGGPGAPGSNGGGGSGGGARFPGAPGSSSRTGNLRFQKPR